MSDPYADQNIYQVIVDYRHAPAWYAPVEGEDAARQRYAVEANRMYRGGINKVLLTRHGIIVAVATE